MKRRSLERRALGVLASSLLVVACGMSRARGTPDSGAGGASRASVAGTNSEGGTSASVASGDESGGAVGTAGTNASAGSGAGADSVGRGGTAPTAGEAGTSVSDDAGTLGGLPASGYALLGAPLLFAPTTSGFGLSVVLSVGDPTTLGLRVRKNGANAWGDPLPSDARAADLAEWHVGGLEGGTLYDYEVVGASGDGEVSLHTGSVTTTRPSGSSFSFALVSDTHIGADPSYQNQGDPTLLAQASAAFHAVAPDFVVNLGDMLDFHEYGFNAPPPDSSVARSAYLNYRAAYGSALGDVPHYAVIGGWDSESGCNTEDEIERARTERLLYLPGPTPDTYPEGGSPFEDYYAFTWGDALFVVLNVYTYTPTCHLLDTYPGLPDDWTLGDAQMAWLQSTLANATSKWRFLMIHHPVGGNGGDDVDSAYGRGGGRAAYVGEQAIVHELMQQYGVQTFFYGHDHVFTDMIVDNIHYALPGSAGAIWLFDSSETGYTNYWADSGWARVDVTPDDVHVQFLTLSGDLLYDYTLN